MWRQPEPSPIYCVQGGHWLCRHWVCVIGASRGGGFDAGREEGGSALSFIAAGPVVVSLKQKTPFDLRGAVLDFMHADVL